MTCPKCGKCLLYDKGEVEQDEITGALYRCRAILYCPCNNIAYDAETAREEGELIEVGKVI